MPYTATTNSPTSYTIDWDTTANTAGLPDQTSTTYTFLAGGGNMPNIAIPASLAIGTYNGTLSIVNAGVCIATKAITLTVQGATVSVGSALSAICQGGTSVALGGSFGGTATAGVWNDGGAGGSFANNTGTTPSTTTWTPLASYSGTAILTLVTSGGSCGTTSAGKSQVVNGQPTATAGGTSTICFNQTATVSGATSSNGTIAWTENGGGTITSGATTLTPVYTPGGTDSAGATVTLTMTVTNSPCSSATATYTVIVKALPTATAGGSATICYNQTATVSGATSSNGTIVWTHNGGGSITAGQGTLTPTYTPGGTDSAGAAVTLTMAVSNSPCTNATAIYTVTVKGIPTATAGGSQTVCYATVATISGATSSNGTIAWTENGGGTITSGATTLTPVYTPGGTDSVGATVTLTMTVTNSPCLSATATYTVIVNPIATVDAGSPQTLCTPANVQLAGIIGGGATSATWSGGGGTFNDNTLLNAVYHPSSTEIANGAIVTLTLTTNDPTGPCNAATDTVVITIKGQPAASSGGTQTICPGTAAVVSGASSSNGTILWTKSGGSGTLTNTTTLTPTYTSVAGDAGTTVTLTMTVANSPCSSATANYTIVISPAAPVAPGTITGSTTVCAGTTQSYNVAAVINATTYTWTVPSGWSITNGQGTRQIDVLVGSSGTGNLSVVASNSCGSTSPAYSVTINPDVTANNTGYTTSSAKTDGNIVTASSLTAPERRGYLKFPLSVLPSGSIITSSTLNITNNANAALSTVANSVAALGNNDPVTTAASTLFTAIGSGTSYNGAQWSNTGTLTLTLLAAANTDIQNRIASPGYIAMGLARGAGTAVYNFFGYNNGANTPALNVNYTAPRYITITINPVPTVAVGGAVAAVCQSGTTTALGGSFAGAATSAQWSDGGAGGSFANNGGLTPATTTYTAAANSISPVTLTLTTSGGLCSIATASKQLTVNPNPTINVGGAVAAICQSGTTLALGGSYGGGATSAVWTASPTGGSFSNNGGATPGTATYTAAANSTSPITLTLTTSGGSCGTLNANKQVVVNPNPTVNAGSALTAICQSGTTAVLGGSFAGGAISAVWSDGGAGGSFTNNTGTTPGTATYTAGANSASPVTLTLTSSGGSCGTATANKQLIVNTNPTVNVGDAVASICQGTTSAALGGSYGGAAVSAVWTDNGAGGIFTNNGGSTPETATYTAAANSTSPVTLTLTTAGGSCGPIAASKSLVVNQRVTPSFTAVNSICAGATLTALPTTSLNGVAGLWSPGIDNTTTTTYTFTPDNGECAVSTSMQIVVNPILTPTFDAVGPICAGSILSPLPTTSNNGYSGTWSPALSNTITRTYTFTPNGGECATSTTLEIIVNPIITPTFTAVAPICSGDLLAALPTTSLNGVTGFWIPAINNTQTTQYTFVPDSGQCTPNILVTLTIVINTPTIYYADTDHDGFGDASNSVNTCSGQPTNYVTNASDCSPADGTKWRMGSFYTDVDNDGYNNGFPTTALCYGNGAPTGFTAVNIGTDCNDSDVQINPNHVEVLGNGIDDNCDGNIDEQEVEYSVLIPTSCGATLQNLYNTIFTQPISGAQGYRFEVTNGATVRTFDAAQSRFNLLDLAGGATYATTYNIRVSFKNNGFWGAYGSSCTVTTPAVPNSTSISSPSCGATLTNISNTIFCNPVTSATGYRFRVSDGTTVVGTYDSNVSRFNLVNIGIANIEFATTYTIDVVLKFGSTWRPDTEYGSACSITTPATPGTSKIISPSCGSTINALWTTIFAQRVTGAQGYKFVVTNDAQTREYITTNSRFSLMNLSGGAVANTDYTIRVDVLYNSSYTEGTQTCVISTSPTASRTTHTALNVFEVKAYPNPFVANFKLDINTSSEDKVGIKVFDMLGREIEARQYETAMMTTVEIGDLYPSGVYNIIVTQGEHVKSIRVIKR